MFHRRPKKGFTGLKNVRPTCTRPSPSLKNEMTASCIDTKHVQGRTEGDRYIAKVYPHDHLEASNKLNRRHVMFPCPTGRTNTDVWMSLSQPHGGRPRNYSESRLKSTVPESQLASDPPACEQLLQEWSGFTSAWTTNAFIT